MGFPQCQPSTTSSVVKRVPRHLGVAAAAILAALPAYGQHGRVATSTKAVCAYAGSFAPALTTLDTPVCPASASPSAPISANIDSPAEGATFHGALLLLTLRVSRIGGRHGPSRRCPLS